MGGYGSYGYRGGYRGKRSADAVATPDADADAFYGGYGYGGYGRGYRGCGGYRGYGGYSRGYGYGGYYGKRSADAVATPNADAFYRGYGYGGYGRGYHGYGGYRGYGGYSRGYGYGGYYGKRSADADAVATPDADAY